MNRICKAFSIKQKFILVGTLFGGFFLYSTVLTSIPKHAQLNKELNIHSNGLLYIKKINNLITQTQKLRGLTNIYLNGNTHIKNKIDKQDKLTVGIIEDIKQFDSKIGTKTTKKEMKELLLKLENNTILLQKDEVKKVFNTYTDIIEKLLSFISFLNYEYLLNGSSNSEIQILLDLYINNIPIITESLGKTRGITAGILAHGHISETQQENIKLLVNLITFNDRQIQIKINTLFKYNKTLENKLKHNIEIINTAGKRHFNIYKSLILNQDSSNISPNDFFVITTKSIDEYIIFHDILYDILIKEIIIKHNNATSSLEYNIFLHILMAIFSLIISILLYNNFINYITKLKNAQQAKSNFLSNMSHEIRTPLNAIMGFITILKEKETNKNKLQYISTIENSSATLLNIINDILDFSKIENEKLTIENVIFNPHKEFHDIVNLFNANANAKNINLSIIISKNLPKLISTDNLRLRQIVSNLISNALKFTERNGQVILKVSYSTKNHKMRVIIKDNGMGVPKNKQITIFKMFSQADSSTTKRFGGTGLGLSISSKLVELLGGKLKLKSQVDKGSIFYFDIPLKEVDINHIVPKSSAEDTIPTSYMKFNAKVLLVEDNEANQMFMKIVLKKFGLTVDLANDGVAAIEKFKNNSYELIFMDENMPHKNGIEATKEIIEYEKNQGLKHTPIVALTANALQGDKEKFIQAGMDEYLSKPLNKDHLIKILNTILSPIGF